MRPPRTAVNLATAASIALICGAFAAPSSRAQGEVAASIVPPAVVPGPTYADIADLGDSAPLVVRAKISKVAQVEPARATGLKPGMVRFYVGAKTQALLVGNAPIGSQVTYLVDVPVDARGRAPKLRGRQVLLFARPVAGRPAEIQLVSPRAQVDWSEPVDARVRRVLTQIVAPDRPARITGVREAIHVPGNLAGEGETQIFLATADQSAASITVRHQQGQPPVWGVSFSELLARLGEPPARDTLEWYRLACFLPNTLPPGVNHSDGAAARRQAESDYRMVLGELGVCARTK